MLSNLSTQFRPTQTRNPWLLPLPAPRADRTRVDDSEQISPPPIAHHTVYEKTRNLQRNRVFQWGTHCFRLGPLSRLAGRPPFELTLSKGALLLITNAYDPNCALSLTQTFNRILFYVCNGRYLIFWGTKSKKRGSENNRVYSSLGYPITFKKTQT